MTSIQDLQDKIQEVKISIAVEKKYVQEQKKKLSKYEITTVKSARKALKKMDKELEELEEESFKLKKKAKDFLSLIDLED